MKITENLLIFLLLVSVSGCTMSASRQFFKEPERSPEAAYFFDSLDRIVKQQKATNKGVTRIEGFPYLAADRFLASMKDRIDSDEAFTSWLDRMAELSLESRFKEIRNIPLAAIKRFHDETNLIENSSREALWESTQAYAAVMMRSDKTRNGFREALKEAVRVDDDYSMTLRVFGIYPVAALPLAYVSEGFFDKLRGWQKTPVEEHQILGELVTYQSRGKVGVNREETSRKFRTAKRDGLGLPVLDKDQKSSLAQRFAPVIVQDSVDVYDTIGEVFWNDKGILEINQEQPVVYYFFSNSFLRGKPIWQINYVFWYPGRLGNNTPWFERGFIDGVTVRVSLDLNGEPFMIDLMNNCGCSHQFFPRKKLIAGIKERSMMFDALVPAWMPETFPEKPVKIRINSGWHQVLHIGEEPTTDLIKQYELRPYAELESLPYKGETYKSMFNTEGLVPGSDRVEPYFMFSSGIRDIGAMRQRGHHPTALIGRAHFDDPNLFDLNFRWEEESKTEP